MDDHRGIGNGEHLDATGERKVVYCHECENEWWEDERGLTCPRCESEATEIVDRGNDPRILHSPSDSLPDLQNHSPWGSTSADSDPEEANIEGHITTGANGSIMISQTIRSTPVRHRSRPEPTRRRSTNPYARDRASEDPNRLMMRQVEGMMANLMDLGSGEGRPRGPDYEDHFPRPGEGPGLRPAQWHPLFDPTHEEAQEPARSRNGSGRGFTYQTHGSPFLGSRVTFTTGRIGGPPRGMADRPGGDELSILLSNLFGNMANPPGIDHQARDGPGARPLGTQFPALLAALMNPANAASGDAVYTQEALDRVISQLMEAHPTSSSAPGPAAPQTISSLLKRPLTSEDLEGNKKVIGKNGEEEMKGECSVCMDDVGVGEEMVFLPCKHWFHDACASAWLSEHDSCPICRKSISPDSNSNSNNNGSNGNGNGNGGGGPRGGILRRSSGSMGFGNNWGSNYNNPLNPATSNNTNPGWGGTTRPSIFTSAGRRERAREREEREAERRAEDMVSRHALDRAAYRTHMENRMLERDQRRREGRNGSGGDPYTRWRSPTPDSYDDLLGGAPWGTDHSRARLSGMGGLASMSNTAGTSNPRRLSSYVRPTPQRGESGHSHRDMSTSPPDRPVPGAFSPSPPRRDSARSSRSGSHSNSGSGTSGGGGGGVLSWVRDKLPGSSSRRGDST